MKQFVHRLTPVILSAVLIPGPLRAAQHKRPSPDVKSAKSAETTDAATEPLARVVAYSERDVLKIKTKVRYTTLIVLPKNEQILDFTCGDKEYWIINGTQNFAYIKPAKPGSQTNLNLISASGNIYSFVLTEVSEVSGTDPDLKVLVQLKDDSMLSAADDAPRFYSAKEVEDYRAQVELAKNETRRVSEGAEALVDSKVSKFIANVRFPYNFEAGKKPFYIRAMYNDDKFTYIQARPEETPTLYEIKDGKPNLVNFEYKEGVYVAGKILTEGYLAIGKKKLAFKREE